MPSFLNLIVLFESDGICVGYFDIIFDFVGDGERSGRRLVTVDAV